MSLFGELARDLGYASRPLLRNPGASVVAALALALGIGVNASSFIPGVGIVLNPLPYPRLDRILTVWASPPKAPADRRTLSGAEFRDLETGSRGFEELAAYRPEIAALGGNVSPENVSICAVSGGFFSVLGTGAELGRNLAGSAVSKPEVVVSHGFWASHFASSRAALGSLLKLNGKSYTVAGIMPDQFDFPLGVQIWEPLDLSPAELNDRSKPDLALIGLAKRGVSERQATAELSAIASRLAREFPDSNQDRTFQAVALRSLFADEVTAHFIFTIVMASFFVLLLACANVANLQLAQAAVRRHEFGLRSALGATRGRIARQLLSESLILSLAAGVIGLVLASWNNAYGRASIPPAALKLVPGLRTMDVDWTVAGLTIAVSILAALVCTAPALFSLYSSSVRAELSDLLRERSHSGFVTGTRNWIRNTLVIAELSLALLLLVGAGLMVDTFHRLLNRYLGFDPQNVLTIDTALPSARYAHGSGVVTFYDRALSSLSASSRWTASALSSSLGPAERLQIEGQADPRPGEPVPAIQSIGGQYLAALRIPLLAGRAIAPSDRPDTQPSAVVSQSFASHYWPGAAAIGHRIRLDRNGPWVSVVGVCGDTVDDWFTGRPSVSVYVPYTQRPSNSAEFYLRTSGDPTAAGAPARALFAALDRELPVDVGVLAQALADERSGVQAAARIMTTYALVALILAATGIYAVVSFFVASRSRDIGVHLALGATRADVFRMTMGQTALLTAAGLAFGVPLSLLLVRLISHLLYGVVDLHFTTFAAVTAALALAALLASYIPARRATHIDPMQTLREN